MFNTHRSFQGEFTLERRNSRKKPTGTITIMSKEMSEIMQSINKKECKTNICEHLTIISHRMKQVLSR